MRSAIFASIFFALIAPSAAYADALSYYQTQTCEIVYEQIASNSENNPALYSPAVKAADAAREILNKEGAAIGKDEKTVSKESYDNYTAVADTMATMDDVVREAKRCDAMLGLHGAP